MNVLSVVLLAALSTSGDDVVARVDQVAITRGAMQRRAELFASQRRKNAPPAVLDSLVADAVLAAEARRLGIESSKEAATFVERETRTAAAQAMLADFAAKAKLDEATLRDAFHKTSDYVAYTYLSYATMEDAKAARERLAKGSSMQAEAKTAITAQVDPSAAPMMMRAQIGEPVAVALLAAKPGDVVGPIESEPGVVVAVLHQKQVGSDEEFAARRPALEASQRKKLAGAARDHLARQLRAQANVQLDEQFLRGLGGSSPTAGELEHVIATVNGKPVKYAELWPQIRSMGGQSSHMANAEVKLMLANRIVEDRLVEEIAVARGFDRAVAGQRAELERAALAAAYAERFQASVPAPTEQEIAAFYDRNANWYAKPFPMVLPQVAADAVAYKRSKALGGRVDELRARARIVVEDKSLVGARK